MEAFTYHRASSPAAAARLLQATSAEKTALSNNAAGQFIAGGTNLTDYMTLNVLRPTVLVDINRLGPSYARIEESASGLRLGALGTHERS